MGVSISAKNVIGPTLVCDGVPATDEICHLIVPGAKLNSGVLESSAVSEKAVWIEGFALSLARVAVDAIS